jgi:glucokinase
MNKVAVGADIGGTNTVIALIDEKGKVLAERTMPTGSYGSAEVFVEELTKHIRAILSDFQNQYQAEGVGIGVPNGDYFNGTVSRAPNLEWEGTVALEAMVQSQLGLPVKITNDANAGALGEMLYGAAAGMKDFAFITLGTGLGSGIVTKGELLYGHDSFAGEMGHLIVKENGRLCACGRRGCLETYVSATGIRRTAAELLAHYNMHSELADIPYADLSSKRIYEAALADDALALRAFDFTAEILGKALANLVAILSPEAVFLFGGLANAGNILLDPVKKYMEDNLLYLYKNKIKLLSSKLPHGHAAVLGAAALIRKEIQKHNG